MKLLAIVLGVLGFVIGHGTADGLGFYQRFLAATETSKAGFIVTSDLVDTNNYGPALTDSAVSWRKFHDSGELAGVKLGMNMSEIVAIWGKPRCLFSRCYIGPRFWYGRGKGNGDLSLCFRRDRLVVIGVSGSTLRAMKFDNDLSGQMKESECESLLGPPTVRNPDPRGTLFVGDIAYRRNALRTDLGFDRPTEGRTPADGKLLFISVRLEEDAKGMKSGEPAVGGNAE